MAFIAMYFSGTFSGISDILDMFSDEWDVTDVAWPNDGSGLRLSLSNSLTNDWDAFFDEAVNDWNMSPSLSLSTYTMKFGDDRCSHVDGVMRVCNGEYGKDIGWQGVNEILYYQAGKEIYLWFLFTTITLFH